MSAVDPVTKARATAAVRWATVERRTRTYLGKGADAVIPQRESRYAISEVVELGDLDGGKGRLDGKGRLLLAAWLAYDEAEDAVNEAILDGQPDDWDA